MPANILTPLQRNVLTALFDAGLGDRGFFLTGGTALAEYYLGHRESDDLDFFTRSEALDSAALDLAEDVFGKLELEIDRKARSDQFARYFVSHAGENPLKVEFCRDVAARMGEPLREDRVVVDSFEDIAVNKICAIWGRRPSEPKDFVDLYFILRETKFSLDYLITRAREKEGAFDQEEGVLQFAVILLYAGEADPVPRMICPLTKKDLAEFLVPRAEELIQRYRPRGDAR